MSGIQVDVEKFLQTFPSPSGSMKPDAGILDPRNFELQVFCTISFSKLREISEESFRKRSGDPEGRKPSSKVEKNLGDTWISEEEEITLARIPRKLKEEEKALLWRRNFLENEIMRGGEGKLFDAKDLAWYGGDWMFNTSGNATLALGPSRKYCRVLVESSLSCRSSRGGNIWAVTVAVHFHSHFRFLREKMGKMLLETRNRQE